jgi:hypothetical protein
MIEGQILYQLPPNLPEQPVRRKSQQNVRASFDAHDPDKPLLNTVPVANITAKPSPVIGEAPFSAAAVAVVDEPLPKTGTRKVYKKEVASDG